MGNKTKQSLPVRGATRLSRNLLCGASFLAGMVVLGAAPAAHAADRHWDANGTGVGTGGIGTWDLTNLNWSPSGDGVSGPYNAPWNNTTLDNAIFGGTAGTVTLGAPITVHNLTFNTASYTLTGSTLTLAGATPTITNSGTTTINSVIAGLSGLTKAGAGTLTLYGANTFTGNIYLNAGSINGSSDAAFGAAGNAIFTGAGASVTLGIVGAGTSRTVNIGDGGTLSLSGTGTGSARITGNGRVFVGNGITMSNDASTYTGVTRFSGVNGVGNAYFTSIGNLGESSSLGAPVTVSDGTIIFAQQSQYSDNVIYVGDGDSSNRNWSISGNSGANIRNRGTGTLTITGDIAVSSGVGFTAETADIALLGTLSGGNYSFSASAGRTFTLGGANTFTGQATIAGAINVSVLADIGTVSSLGVGANIALSTGTLSYTGAAAASNRLWVVSGASTIANEGTGALNLSGDAAFQAGGAVDTLTLGGSFAGENTFSGILSGAGNLTGNGTGTWVLGGANTFTGNVTVDAGTLRAGTASAFGAPRGLIVNGGTLDLGGFDLTAPSLTGTGGTVALGASTLTVAALTAQSYAGSITGSGGLRKTGAGTLTLTGASTYTGATTILGGKLALDFSGAGGPANNILSASSSLVLSGGIFEVLGAAGETNNQSFTGLAVNAGSNTVRAINGAGGIVNLNLGTITRNGGLVNFALPTAGTISTSNTDGLLGGWATINGTDYAKVVGGNILAFDETDYTDKDDAGTWVSGDIVSDTANAANTPFFGVVSSNVQLGGLRYTAAADSAVSITSGNTLGVDGTIIVAPSTLATNQTITGGFLTGGAGGGTLGVQHNGTGALTIGSAIVNNGGDTAVTKGGAGTLILSGANSYTGATILTGGTLRVNSIANGGGMSSIGASSNASSNLVLEAGELEYTGTTAMTDRGFTLVNGGTSRTIDITNGATNLTFTGQVTSSDDSGFTKIGAGQLTLSNAGNDYVGVTTVNGGILAVNTLTNGGVASGIGAATSDSANIVLAGGKLAYLGGTVSSDRGMTFGAGNGGVGVTDAGTTLTLTGTLAGTGGLSKEGPGTLVLSGANVYENGTTVASGVLRAGAANVFGSGGMTVTSGALLDLNNFNNAVNSLGGAGNVNLGTGTLTVNSGGVFTGTISGTGGLTRAGTNQFTLTLNGCNNSYTGVTTITDGTNLSVNCLANGGVASGIGASSSASSNLLISNGVLSYSGGSTITDRGITLGGTAAINVVQAATTLEFSGNLVGTGGLRKDGLGTLVLSGINTSTGNARIIGGILRAASSSALGSGALTLDNVAGVQLDLNGFNNSVAYLTAGGTTGGGITLGGATLTITTGNNGATVNYAGAITGTGSLIKNGAQIQRLSGCASDYSGSTTINGGIIEATCLTDGGLASSIGASGAGASSLILNGGTLRYVGAGGSTNRQFTLGASAGNALDASGTGAINFTSSAPFTFSSPNTAQTLTLTGTNTGNNILAAQITNNGTGLTALTKTGVGTWNLTNPASSYTGITTISGGVLGVDKLANGGVASSIGSSSAAAANLVIGNASTLRYTGAGDTTNRLFTLAAGVTFLESSGTGAVVFTDTGVVTLQGNNQARVIALGGTNTGNNTLAGSIGNAGTGVTTLAKNDSGTWVLTGNHTYTGSTNVNGGLLSIGGGGTTGSVASATINNFGTLAFNRSDSLTYGGAIVGTGAVQQNGAGTTILTGTSTYTGGTTINAGVLQLGNGGTTGGITGDVLNNSVLTFNRSNLITFGGVISGTGRVTQGGAGTTVLTGINTYSGGTAITAGTLQISRDENLGAASGVLSITDGTLHTTATFGSARNVALAGNATLLTDAGTDFVPSGAITGSGGLTKSGAGQLILTGTNTYAGGTTISAGSLRVGNGTNTGSIIGNVVNNGALIFHRANAIAFDGLISGTGSVTQFGGGVLTLTGANSYTGATTLNAGTTVLINGDQSAATGLTTVNTGAMLGGSGTIGGDVFIDNGGILSPGNSPGTLTIAGDLTLSGG
jgi:fibronectin-binding autotransporter adhesin